MNRILLSAAALALLAAAPAHAADKGMVSYDADSPKARELTGEGLTFSYVKGLLHTRITAVRATAVPVGVTVKPLDDGRIAAKLDRLAGDNARLGTLYKIADAQDAQVMVQAFCPGSKTGWLSIGPIEHARPLKVLAFGNDPGTGEPKLCAAMDFQFRGEWRLPDGVNHADPTDAVFAPDY
ncbi:MAG: hypothetical protein ACM3YN_00540 [Parcubacteria group bacterium]